MLSSRMGFNLSKYSNLYEHVVPIPGTALYHEPEKYGIRIKSNVWSDYSLMKVIIDTNHLLQDDIRNYYAQATGIDDIRNYYAQATEIIGNREED